MTSKSDSSFEDKIKLDEPLSPKEKMVDSFYTNYSSNPFGDHHEDEHHDYGEYEENMSDHNEETFNPPEDIYDEHKHEDEHDFKESN